MTWNPYGKVRYKVKSCGKRHGWCKGCRPDITKVGFHKKEKTSNYTHKTGNIIKMKDTTWLTLHKEIELHAQKIAKLRAKKKDSKVNRVFKIQALQKKGFSLREIGKELNLSGERIRQLLLKAN